MNAITSDVIGHISGFLDRQEYLNFSVVTKQEWVFNKKKKKKKIRYAWIMPVIKAHEENWFISKPEDLDWVARSLQIESIHMGGIGRKGKIQDLCDYINELSSHLLQIKRFPVGFSVFWDYPPLYPKPCYYADKFASSMDFGDEAVIHENEKICMLYRCRMKGKIRRAIQKSLTLRALVG